MTLLARKIDAIDNWMAIGDLSPEQVDSSPPPLSAVLDFMPRPFDKARLSFFEIADDLDALRIAGAFALQSSPKLDGGRMALLAVDIEKITDASFTIEITPGGLQHEWSDDRHREIKVDNLDGLIILTKLYMKGKLFSFEGPSLGKSARSAARSNEFNFSNLRQSLEVNVRTKNILRLVEEGCLIISGVMPS